jgi:hypothetical protein
VPQSLVELSPLATPTLERAPARARTTARARARTTARTRTRARARAATPGAVRTCRISGTYSIRLRSVWISSTGYASSDWPKHEGNNEYYFFIVLRITRLELYSK